MSGIQSSPLSEIFGSGSSAGLIVFLVYNHDREFSMQEMADRMKTSKAKVSRMKEGLLKYGVIRETRKSGKTGFYRYDRNTKYGKLLYDLVFAASTPERAIIPTAATTAPAAKAKPRDDGGKIIIGS